MTPAFSPGRVIGIDVARGIAVLGMIVAHTGSIDNDGVLSTILSFADGRSSILFATLAGVSLAIMTGRMSPYVGPDMVAAKTRILTRAAWLVLISALLSLMNEIVALILVYYAVWFVLAIPFLKWRPRNLFIAAGCFATLGPLAVTYGMTVLEKLGMVLYGGESDILFSTLITGVYPGVVYMAYVLAGLGIGRLNLSSRSIQASLAMVGTGLALIFYSTSYLLTGLVPAISHDDFMDGSLYSESSGFGWDSSLSWPDPSIVVSAAPHSNTIFEAFGSGGVAIAILGLCLLGGRILGYALYPIAAVGSMSLTAYSAHIVTIWNSSALTERSGNWPLVWLLLAILAFCTIWHLIIGRGPLEWILHRSSVRISRSVVNEARMTPSPHGDVPPQPAPVPVTSSQVPAEILAPESQQR